MLVTSSVIPNIGKVVNQSQGFVMEVTIKNDQAVPLYDVEVAVTGVDSHMTVGKKAISLPASVAAKTSEVVKIVFETATNIPTGDYDIEYTVSGYIGGPLWKEVAQGGGFVYDVGLRGLYPADPAGGTFHQQVEIVAE